MRVVAEVTYNHPRGRGPREPPSPLRLLPPSVPIAESSWNQKARGGCGSARQPPGTQSRMESGSRGEMEVSSPGVISCGRHNTSHELGGLKQEKLTLSQFWRLEVQNQGCPCSLQSLGENPCLASSRSWCCWLLGLWPHHSSPSLSSLGLLPSTSSPVCVSYEDICHWISGLPHNPR